MRLGRLSLLLLTISACVGCGGASEDLFVLTPKERGTTSRVPVGGTFGIRIEGISTREYEWRLKDTPPHLRSDGSDMPPSEDISASGARHTVTWRFTALRPGRGAIRYQGRPDQVMEFEVVAE